MPPSIFITHLRSNSPSNTTHRISHTMAPLHTHFHLLFLLVLFALLLVPHSSSSSSSSSSIQHSRRHLLEKNRLQEDDDSDGVQVQLSVKKKSGTTPYAPGTTSQSKNKTKIIKPKSTTTANSTKSQKLLEKTTIKKLNSTSKPSNLTKPTSKTTNSTIPTSKTTNSTSKTSNLTKPTSNSTKPTSKTANSTKATSKSTNSTKPTSKTPKSPSISTQKSPDPTKKTSKPVTKAQKSTKKSSSLTFQENDEEDDDFVSEFRDLPARFQQTFIPDLEVISTTSKAYLTKANKHISKGFNPIVGKKYAPMVASIISFAFILIPFLLVSLIFNRIKAYFSLQKLIIFIQIYLSIYFSILSLSSLVTGLEPLKFFYATSQSTYVCLQLLQTLAYVLYLLVLLMYLVLVFSTDSTIVSRLLALGQTFVGFAVGLHYYVTVFHRAVLRQPPKSSWKVHAVYATCFLVICLLGTAERRKKAYVVDGSEEEKKS